MKYNKLGKSDIVVSEVGIGCMSFSTHTRTESECIIQKSIDEGINYFDTADLYDFGENEKLLGQAIKGYREKLVIASKVGNRWKEDKSGWTWDVSGDYINEAIDESLQRLQTDYIDLYQIHGGTKEDNFEEVVYTLEKLVEHGKIRTYGISSIRPNVFLRYANESNIVSNMMQFSLLDTRPEPYLPPLQTADVSILARGSFAQGMLLGKPANDYLDHSSEQVEIRTKQIDLLANELSVSKEAIALAFLLKYHKISSAVVGVSTKEQLDKLFTAINELDNLQIDFGKLNIPKINYTTHV